MRLTIVGDIFPGDEEITIGYGIKSLFQSRKFRLLWQSNIREILGETDCVIGNLESPLLDEDKSVKVSFHGIPEFADFLKTCGFNVLNIANNHILEQGKGGFLDTLHCLKKSGITAVGMTDDNDAPDITTYEHDGIRIVIAGFCDESICSIPYMAGTYNKLDEERIVKAVNKIKDIPADVRTVILHWGNEYIHFPSLQQRHLAYKLIDMGVDLIIGHHPHCIQPYEKYNQGHIFYSLGNFCFDYLQSDRVKIGMVAKITLTHSGIERIELNGVDLYDTVYSNQLVRASLPDKFNSFYTKIANKYRLLQSLDDEQYEKVYIQTLKSNRLTERINMRKWILWSMLRASLPRKYMLFKNLWNFYHIVK